LTSSTIPPGFAFADKFILAKLPFFYGVRAGVSDTMPVINFDMIRTLNRGATLSNLVFDQSTVFGEGGSRSAGLDCRSVE